MTFFSILPLLVYEEFFYEETINKAKRLIDKRDPNDFHLIPIALKLDCPVWSNDKDFEGLGVKVYKTLDLIED